MMAGSMPMPFPIRELVDFNKSTHSYDWSEDTRCGGCDCRPWGITSEWPCGIEPPRVALDWEAYAGTPLAQ